MQIAHISVADRCCAPCAARLSHATHIDAANDDYCRCINVMCSIAIETSFNKIAFKIKFLLCRVRTLPFATFFFK